MQVNEISAQLHSVFNSLKRYSFPLDKKSLPSNGIYILFEKGETFNILNRVVRIGTHTGNGRFIKRLEDHFEAEKQRNSIFRKHIGRSLLNKNADPYLSNWDLPFKKGADKERNKDKVDLDYEKRYELKITEYIQQNLSFVVIPNVNSVSERKELESALIAAIAQDTITKASANWLGKNHPDPKMSHGKLWNIQHLKYALLDEKQLGSMNKYLRA